MDFALKVGLPEGNNGNSGMFHMKQQQYVDIMGYIFDKIHPG